MKQIARKEYSIRKFIFDSNNEDNCYAHVSCHIDCHSKNNIRAYINFNNHKNIIKIHSDFKTDRNFSHYKSKLQKIILLLTNTILLFKKGKKSELFEPIGDFHKNESSLFSYFYDGLNGQICITDCYNVISYNFTKKSELKRLTKIVEQMFDKHIKQLDQVMRAK